MAGKEEPNSEIAPEIRRILRENEQYKRREKGYLGQIALLKNQTPRTEAKPSPEAPESSQTKPEEAHKPHFIGPWQQYCADCGGKNPDFKDETKCKTCGMHLGSIEGLAEIKACPNCGSGKAEKI